jgi:ABC-type dipeptide/oligopeptide/nickel transport system ATPase component
MRRFMIFIVLIALGASTIWLYNDPQIQDKLKEYVENGDIRTLEARYTADQIMAQHRFELLGSSNRVFQEPSIKFYPYLLMEAKFVRPNKKTGEGTILWGLVDGEMVLDTETWEKTHGFEDAINANASPTDFKIINTLALSRYNGTITRDKLQSELNTDLDTLDKWIESAKNKHLVTTKGNEVTLHFQNPKILVDPVTNIKNWIVTKPYEHQQRVASKYSKTQLEKVAKAAFGEDFSIRTTSEVFLPVYAISVLNPDGSLLTSYWNALNGERIP